LSVKPPGSSGPLPGADPATETFGLRCWSGTAEPMARAHRHDDIEINVVAAGSLHYRFGARPITVPAGATSVFWAALPHQLVAAAPGSTTHWLTVPLEVVLRWRTGEDLVAELLSGVPLLTAASAGHDADRAVLALQIPRWALDLASGEPQLRSIALLEIEAFLRRVLRQARWLPPEAAAADPVTKSRSRAATMAATVATRCREPLTVEDVAAAVHLSPQYAMTVFRAATGTTIGAYLTLCRVAEAQRLLVTTGLTVPTIAHAAGFGSVSRLYAAFAAAGLPAPAAYRRIQQRAAGWAGEGG
jgi:AraC-like DNA-binding protein